MRVWKRNSKQIIGAVRKKRGTKMNMRNDRQHTFAFIMQQVEAPNSARLIERARTANRLAKLSYGKSKAKAYQVKNQALRAFTSKFPNEALVAFDPLKPWLLLIHFRMTPWALHTPDQGFKQEPGDAHLAA
jgi:hypothetical protein